MDGGVVVAQVGRDDARVGDDLLRSSLGDDGTQLERQMKLEEYSVSNRGLRPRLVGSPEQIRARVAEYQAVGLDLLLLQMSPQAEEMERFAAQVIQAA